ncbi:MAG: cytidine deaminase [Elusimicrobia bacterium RIFCSPLOWO2_01_FULL_60_11]|nr:MAG: cytidine deaminase [Elusimicrobia bacterium RIFCSPLOWO2_01_FULL_60_11]
MSGKAHLSLIERAKKARLNAFAPYSRFKVGAAVLSGSGKIYSGCNMENASYGLTVCAERNAVAAMVAAGEREIMAVAVVTDLKTPASPCGACRQVIAEFGPGAKIVMANLKGAVQVRSLSALLPLQFKKQKK